ncbi:MAG: DUF433 domain-containing protein [Pseudonocardiaceae bacterium]
MLWSYRDLVFLRLLARLRQSRMPRGTASVTVARLRDVLARPESQVTSVRLDKYGIFLDDETHDMLTGQGAFDQVLALTQRFDLLEPIEGVNRRPTWGPDLVEPSDYTYISPHVMGGEPCVDDTRIPSATVLALVDIRGLDPGGVVRLYPQLTREAVEDAVDLERRMRRLLTAA